MTEMDLPQAELDVMQCLWKDGELTARAIRESLAKRRPMTHSSVSTLLNRLEQKAFIKRCKAPTGKAFVYSALVAESKSRRRVISNVLDRVFHGSGVDLVASLFETRPPTKEELTQLQELLEQLKSESRSSKRGKRGGKS